MKFMDYIYKALGFETEDVKLVKKKPAKKNATYNLKVSEKLPDEIDGIKVFYPESLADCKEKAEYLKKETPFILILDGIEDPHNLGSIIRTAETAGVHGVIIPKRRAASVNATVSKTSAGAVEYMKIARVNNINEAIKTLKNNRSLDMWYRYGHRYIGKIYERR